MIELSSQKILTMKKTGILVLVIMLCQSVLLAQENIPALDKSPLDISYFPANHPMAKVQETSSEPLIARVIYSRPSMNGRKIFGGLIEYSKVWRLGANEATEIEFFKDVYINKAKVKKGRYTLFVIPNEDKWTVIINKETDTWGAFGYNVKKDILRVDVPVQTVVTPIEACSIYFEKSNSLILLQIQWENTKITLPISLNKSN